MRSAIDLIRRGLAALLLFSMVGIAVELVLLEHFESRTQWIPLALLALGLPASALAAFRPTRATLTILRTLMVLFVASGLLGVILHYRGNVAFELEMSPALKGTELIRKALMGATPALSPGVMVQLGLLGLLYSFRHPQWSSGHEEN